MTPPQRNKTKASRWRTVWLALGALGLFLGQSVLFGLPALGLLRARSWTPVDATIMASGYTTSTHRETLGMGAPRSVTSTTLDTVVFSYAVNGQSFSADTPSFFERWTLGKNSPRFPKGQAFVAYVDPNDPYAAVLVNRVDSGFWVCLGVTAYFLLLFVATVQVHRRARQAWPQLGGVVLVGVGMLVVLGALIANTDRPVAHFVALGAFGGLPIYFGVVSYLSRWATVPGPVSALVMVGAFITLIAGLVAAS